MKKHRRELANRISAWERDILGYKVDRAKQIENVSMAGIGIGAAVIVGLYFEHLPVMSALIFRF